MLILLLFTAVSAALSITITLAYSPSLQELAPVKQDNLLGDSDENYTF